MDNLNLEQLFNLFDETYTASVEKFGEYEEVQEPTKIGKLAHLEKKATKLEKLADETDNEIEVLEAKLAKLKQRQTSLKGSRYDKGLVARAKANLAEQKQIEQDSHLPKPVWDKEGFCSGDLVIDKITAKRIYLKDPGSTSSRFYDRKTGTHSVLTTKLNVDATLKVWEQYQASL